MKKTVPAFNTWITLALGSAVAAWFAIVFFDTNHTLRFDDFLVFAEAGEFARAKRSVYFFVDGWPAGYKFKYSPFAAVFYGYLFPSSVDLASWVHFGLSLLAWLLIGIWTVAQIRRPSFLARPAWPLLVCVGAFAIPLRDELKMGQCNGFVALAVLIAVTQSRRAWLAGLALAFAILLKTYAVFILPWFVFRKNLRVLAMTAVFGALLGFGVPALAYGPAMAWSEHVRWIQILTDSTAGLILRADNASLLSFFSKLTQDLSIGRFVWMAGIAAFLWGAWTLRGRSPARAYAYWGASVLPLTPLSWPYWNLMAFPAAFFCLQSLKNSARWKTAVFVIALLIGMNKVNGTAWELGLPLGVCVLLAVRLATAKPPKPGDSPV